MKKKIYGVRTESAGGGGGGSLNLIHHTIALSVGAKATEGNISFHPQSGK